MSDDDEENLHIYDEARNSSSGFDVWQDEDDMDLKLPRIHGNEEDTAHLLMVYNTAPRRDRKKINNIAGGALLGFVLFTIVAVDLYGDPDISTYKRPTNTGYYLSTPPPELEDICDVDNLRSDQGRILCQDMCQPATCCIEKDPYSSCFEENKDMCSMYTPCGSLYIGQRDFDVPPAPSNLDRVCSMESLSTDHGFFECQTICLIGDCCLSNRWDSCFFANIEICNTYSPCQNLNAMNHRSAVKQVEDACKASSIMHPGGRKKCEELCKARECCFTSGKSNCFADNQLWCGEYAACEDLNSMSNEDIPDPIDFQQDLQAPMDAAVYKNPREEFDMAMLQIDVKRECHEDMVMTQDDLDKCEMACLPAVCCFTEGNCYSSNSINCDDFSVCESFVVTAFDDELYDDYVNPIEFKTDLDEVPSSQNEDPRPTPARHPTLEDICSDENTNSWEGRNSCELECRAGFCCIGIPYDCSQSDQGKCLKYLPACAQTWREQGYANQVAEKVNSQSRSNADNQESPTANDGGRAPLPLAPSNLDDICSDENLRTPQGQEKCEMECDFAICCTGLYSDCSSQTAMCESYSPCHAIWGSDRTTNEVTSPLASNDSIQNHHSENEQSSSIGISSAMDRGGMNLPPQGLDVACTASPSKDEFQQCKVLCKTASCCFMSRLEGGCANTAIDYCRLWNFCTIVFETSYELDLETGSAEGKDMVIHTATEQEWLEIKDLCWDVRTPEEASACDDACEQWACCDENDDFGCQDDFPDECADYDMCPSDEERRKRERRLLGILESTESVNH